MSKKTLRKIRFFNKKKILKRLWGIEEILVIIPKILSLKLIKINKGMKGGLQYHRLKNECGFILSGKLLVRYDNGSKILKKRILKKGDCFHFPPGSIHQEEALTNVKIIEGSTPHFNDRVRVEKKYNLKSLGGLKTTSKKDIKFL